MRSWHLQPLGVTRNLKPQSLLNLDKAKVDVADGFLVLRRLQLAEPSCRCGPDLTTTAAPITTMTTTLTATTTATGFGSD